MCFYEIKVCFFFKIHIVTYSNYALLRNKLIRNIEKLNNESCHSSLVYVPTQPRKSRSFLPGPHTLFKERAATACNINNDCNVYEQKIEKMTF